MTLPIIPQPDLPASLAQINLAVFEGRDSGRILWQPRIDYWYQVNRKRGTLPAHLAHCSLFEVYDYCHASPRYFLDSLPVRVRYHNVEVRDTRLPDGNLQRIWQTPLGCLTECFHFDEWGLSMAWHEYMLKSPTDVPIYKYILEDEVWFWDEDGYQKDLAAVAGRGWPMYFHRRSPLQSLIVETMGFERTIYFMHDDPKMLQVYLDARKTGDDQLYEVITAHPGPIFNIGENIDSYLDQPPFWRKYLLPYYKLRCEQLSRAGIFTSIHVDGSMRHLLNDLRDCPTDSIEACTPLPQGDVSLQQIKSALGEKILLDGIPAIYFLPSYPLDELFACARQVVELFYPRLILGVSDEVPPDADIERVRQVGELAQTLV